MPKAVLWDIGNVLVRWDPRTLYSKIYPDPVECDRFLSSVCTMEWHIAHDLGVSFAENRARLVARFPEHEPQIRAWQERWWEMFSGHIEETAAAIAALHARGVPQYGLTNMSHETFDGTIRLCPGTELIADFVVSAHERLIKPDPAIFTLTCERFGYAPDDFLFVDDSALNIESARALGFDVHHFTDPAALRPALEARGLL